MGRTLCIYALHEYTLNLEYFIKHGLVDDPEVDFYFVVNNPQLKLTVPKGKVVNRENKNFDFGGWSQILLTDDLYKQYDYFVLINSTVRGPFYPLWYTERNWVKLFTSKITDDLKLFGILIGNMNHDPHVQSMFLVTDRIGMEIGISTGIFKLDEPPMSMGEIICQKEIRYSTLILERGYNIGCMLKSLHGIDFRKKSSLIGILFEENNYYGTNVHPYETIFCKISNKLLKIGGSGRLVDLYTNWEEHPPGDTGPLIEKIHYLLTNPDLPINGVNTPKLAQIHFNRHGFWEGRSHRFDQPLYYKVDLNPNKSSGLINQLYSLVNAVLFSHYVGRYLVVTGFYPQYNSDTKIGLSKIIDLPHLNLLLAKLNLSTYLIDFDALHPPLKNRILNCQKSRYYNPAQQTFNIHKFLGTLIHLKSETERFLDLGGTFSIGIFLENPEQEIKQLAIKLLGGIKFTRPFTEIIDSFSQEKYKTVHFRLEDDMLLHKSEILKSTPEEIGVSVYQRYKERLKKFVSPDQKFFLATHLTKSQYKMNYLVDELKRDYPKMFMSGDWREKFPSFYFGREIDAIVDYLLCVNGTSFLGWSASTFTNCLIYSFNECGKLFYTIDDPIDLFPSPNLPFTIMKSHVNHGKLGLSGQLGFNENGISSIIMKSMEMISAHAPSTVHINISTDLRIRGACSPTSKIIPRMTFFCDDQLIGEVNGVDEETEEILITPGLHILRIETSTIQWAHSIWLIN